MTGLLWVLVCTGILLCLALVMLSVALFRITSHPIRVIDVTPDEPAPISAREALERADAAKDGRRPVWPSRWPHS